MKEKHLIISPEKELVEKVLENKYLDRKLKKTWELVNSIGCEIDNPLSMNFNISNKKADNLRKILDDIDFYIQSQSDIDLRHKYHLKKIINNIQK